MPIRWDAIAGARVAVFGDFCLDVYWRVDETAVTASLETGEPVHRVTRADFGLGGAGNVVANLAALGVGQIRAIGVRGGDAFGQELERRVGEHADVTGLLDLGPHWTTHVYVKPIHGVVERSRYDLVARDGLSVDALTSLRAALVEAAGWADVLLVNQQVEGLLTEPEVQRAVNCVVAEFGQLPVLVDARDVAGRLVGVMNKLNLAEARHTFAPSAATTDEVLSAVQQAARRDRRAKFVTLGAAGIAAVDAGGVERLPAVDITGEVDAVGAGDTVLAALGVALGTGHDVTTAAALANLAASITVRKLRTTGTASVEEIRVVAREPMYAYHVELADSPDQARRLADSDIELVEPFDLADVSLQHAVFDHDGTLSTLRAGWESVMAPLMVSMAIGEATVDAGVRSDVTRACVDLIERTTGAPTIAQMQGLVELAAALDLPGRGALIDAAGCKERYLVELRAMVAGRVDRLARGELQPEDFQIKGAARFLRILADHGVQVHLASGTDTADVVSDATALRYAHLFAGRILGAGGAGSPDAKRAVIGDLMARVTSPRQIVVFGDGPVEMREARRVGALAVGVCSDEVRRYGVNPAKRARLIRAGAHLLIPDFSRVPQLLGLLGLAPTTE